MALITDPDQLNQATEVVYDTGALTVQLLIAGNLSEDGCTGQCLYSFTKEEWTSDATKIPFLFPIEMITPESFEFINGWAPADDTTRKLLRQCGWAEKDSSGNVNREYMGFISLGNIDSTSKTVGDKAYYAFAGDASRTVFEYAGPVDEAVQIFGTTANGDAGAGDFDNRSAVLTAFIREQGKTFDQVTTTDIGVSVLTYIAYRFPLSEGTDLKITETDVNIGSQAPYTGMGITYYGSAQASNTFLTTDLSGGPHNFHVVIEPNGGTANEVYNFIQYQLRQDADIDDGAGTVNGFLADALGEYVGDTFKTKQVSTGGVALDADNLDSNDINSVVFVDDTGTERTFPYVAAGTLVFNANLQNDAASIYRMFFTTNPAGDFGSATAVLVDDNSGADISGAVGGSPSIAWSFDYDGNNQGGRTPGTDADVTVVAIGLDGAQHVVTTATITRSVGQNISLVAALERNFNNP